jgi:hypothetical protein
MDINSQQAIEPFTNLQQPETSDPLNKLIAPYPTSSATDG